MFIPYISRQLQSVSRLDLASDRYIAGNLRTTARAKRGKGIRQRVIASACILKNWQIFLRVHGPQQTGTLQLSLKDTY